MVISHRERLETTLNGEKPDRIPIALWRHFPVEDQDPINLAKATIAFQEQFDFDLVKVMPPSSFCIKDWGAADEWQGNPEGSRTYTKFVVQHPEDWLKLEVLDPYKGFLGDQLNCLSQLNSRFEEHTPFIQTIFNPLSQAKNLVGANQLLLHLRKYPDALHHGLRTIQETTMRFIDAAKRSAIAGIFFVIQHASHQILSEPEFLEFGKAYDLAILNETHDLWANMVHIHGLEIMFELVSDYPVQILNWHDRETPPKLSEGIGRFPGSVCGGLSRVKLLELGNPEMIRMEAKNAVEQLGGKRLILGTGCGLRLTTPIGNIQAARDFVEEVY